MSLLSFHDYRNSRLETVRTPFARLPSTLGENFRSSLEAEFLGRSTGEGSSLAKAGQEAYDWYEAMTGKSALPRATELAVELAEQGREQRTGDAFATTMGEAPDVRDPRVARAFLEEVFSTDPELSQLAPRSLQERALEIPGEAERTAADISERSTTAGAAAGFAGLLVSGVLAPEALASMVVAPLGVASVGMRAVGKVAAREGAIGAISETAVQPIVQDWRGRAGLQSGFWEAVKDVALVGGASAALGGLVRGVVETRRAIRAGKDAPSGAARRVYDSLSPNAQVALESKWSDVDAVAAIVGREYELNPKFRERLTATERAAIERANQDLRIMETLGIRDRAAAQATREAAADVTEAAELGLPVQPKDTEGVPTPRTDPLPDPDADPSVSEVLGLEPEDISDEVLEDIQEAVRRAVEEGTATPPPRDTLPRELRGAKPRYQQHPLEFESDVDKALYITAQKKKSRRDADYREYLRRQGLSDRDIDELGPQVRDAIRALAAEAGDDADALVVPTTRPVEPQPARTRPPRGDEPRTTAGAANRPADLPPQMAAERAAAEEHLESIRSMSDDKLAADAEGELRQRAQQEDPSVDMEEVKRALDEMERLARIRDAVEGCRNG